MSTRVRFTLVLFVLGALGALGLGGLWATEYAYDRGYAASQDTVAEGVPMTVVFEIEQTYSDDATLKFVEGTEAAWFADFMVRPPGKNRPQLWVNFADSTLLGSGSVIAIDLTDEQTEQLRNVPIGARVVVTYTKRTPPLLPSSIIDSRGKSFSFSDDYLEGWLADHARSNFTITIEQP